MTTRTHAGPGSDFLSDAVWRVEGVPAGSISAPDELTGDDAVPAQVPGTVASALAAAGRDADDLDGLDWWFTTTVDHPGGPAVLTCDGLATVVDVWVNGAVVATSVSMFAPVTVDVDLPAGPIAVALHCRSLDAHLATRRPRGRWRSSMISAQGLRWVRASMLGRAPVYTGAPAPVGPWRPVRWVEGSPSPVTVAGVWEGGGVLIVSHGGSSEPLRIRVAGQEFEVSGEQNRIRVDGVEPWWPHTHGAPRRYDVEVVEAGVLVYRGSVGFRTVALDFDTMFLSVNDVRVFCRGGCWVPLDPVSLQNDPGRLRDLLTRVRDAGLNMLRVTGTLVYEDDAFFELCSELGILVWQDLMTPTVDPPDDRDHHAVVLAEVRALLHARRGAPTLAVISGGSETHQQPTMLGVDASDVSITLLDTVIPDALAELAPEIPYVVSTPSGGDLATHVSSGVAHYFGVGGYRRSLSDVRGAGVRFAAECLAFSVPPSRRAIERRFGSVSVAGHHPEWKALVPRDRGSSWDFEDVRDHYVRSIFGVEPAAVRWEDPERYLDLGSAAVCEAVTESYTWWRGSRSECHGALVLTLGDVGPGAGWGFLDGTGEPKAPWYALARVSAPIAVIVTDEGQDGFRVEVINDRPAEFSGSVRVQAFSRAGTITAEGDAGVVVAAHGCVVTSVDAVLGRFTDVNHAHVFGTRGHDAVSVTVHDRAGETVAQDIRLVGAPALPLQNTVGLTAHASLSDGSWSLTVGTEFAAQYVCVDVDAHDPSDSWFHLAPGTERTVALTGPVDRVPSGHVRALNSVARGRITRDR